jgi:uncharacterized protein YecE (DUF72 family)
VVEVQQTFYDPPQDETLVRRRRQAPPGFEFTLKASQLVTHDASSPAVAMATEPRYGVSVDEVCGPSTWAIGVLSALQRAELANRPRAGRLQRRRGGCWPGLRLVIRLEHR